MFMGVDVFVQPEENDMIQKFSNYLKKLANYKDKYSRIYQSVGDVEIFEKQFTEWFRGGVKESAILILGILNCILKCFQVMWWI